MPAPCCRLPAATKSAIAPYLWQNRLSEDLRVNLVDVPTLLRWFRSPRPKRPSRRQAAPLEHGAPARLNAWIAPYAVARLHWKGEVLIYRCGGFSGHLEFLAVTTG
jgi:hypothetical protein